MRWNKPIYNRPIGTSEYKDKIALFPTRMDDKSWIWLEFYQEQFQWVDSIDGPYWLSTSKTPRTY